MPRYILDFHVPNPYSKIKEIRETDEDYTTALESIGDFARVPTQKRELMCSFLNSQPDVKSGVDISDQILPCETISGINQGQDDLNSTELKRSSYDHGDDHFLQVLNSQSPNVRETSELLEEVVELEADLKGKLRHLSSFRDEIKEIGKLLKTTPSRSWRRSVED